MSEQHSRVYARDWFIAADILRRAVLSVLRSSVDVAVSSVLRSNADVAVLSPAVGIILVHMINKPIDMKSVIGSISRFSTTVSSSPSHRMQSSCSRFGAHAESVFRSTLRKKMRC